MVFFHRDWGMTTTATLGWWTLDSVTLTLTPFLTRIPFCVSNIGEIQRRDGVVVVVVVGFHPRMYCSATAVALRRLPLTR
ncbi:hypothetical protein QBC47DRAFT_394302 [Echria macrotheca]|uniref:Uncharacterized protein n=1 Tax=Echria macrotheca TaxID=438768 RepID=A0AAJ0F1Q5_9PEZI|nr:hypothetical protein QBC47DRAFT_394302 [Echria macrotheca]